jgi:hypothetical protein
MIKNSLMYESGVFLDYRGPINFDIIDSLLVKLKKTREFKDLNTVTGKRLYSLIVECLENICKHSELSLSENPELYSSLTVMNSDRAIIIRSGNPITLAGKTEIINRLDHINLCNDQTLHALYEEKLKSDIPSNDRCAGLGFIYMALKSGNKLKYKFTNLPEGNLFFEIEITLNKYIMRKLIIDPKSNSPKIILDPEKNFYMIAGESRPPDVREFYAPVLAWLEEFGHHLTNTDEIVEPVVFNFSLDYFNSSSGKLILDICKHLGGLRTNGKNINVNWHFEKDDFDMLEAGKEISKIVKFPFEYVIADKN